MSWISKAVGKITGSDKAVRAARKAASNAAEANKRMMDEMAAMRKQTQENAGYIARQEALKKQQEMKTAADSQAQLAAKAAADEQSSANAIQEKNRVADSVNATPMSTAPAPSQTGQQAKIAALGAGAGAAASPIVAQKKEETAAPALNAFTMPSTKNVQFGGS